MEYAIWGVPPGETEETLLVATPKGKPITSKDDADRWALACERRGATEVRIQAVDMAVGIERDWRRK